MELRQVRRASEAADEVRLVESGLYAKIRHPLYSSLLFFALAAFLKQPSLFSAILMFGIFFTLYSTVTAEEKIDEEKFGTRYSEYKQRTKMFIPYII